VLKITDFIMPNHHPFGMLEGYSNAYEKERWLATLLGKNILAKGFLPVEFPKDDDFGMVEDGLLKRVEGGYVLTKISKGLLYAEYGKEE